MLFRGLRFDFRRLLVTLSFFGIFFIQAEVTESQLIPLRAPLTTNYRDKPFKEALAILEALVKANPGDLRLNRFLCDFALMKANSENSSYAFKLWTKHLSTVPVDAVYETRIADAVRDNTFNSPPDKYPPIKTFLSELLKKAPTDSRTHQLFAKISEDNHPRISALVAQLYLLSPAKERDAFLSSRANSEARMNLLAELSSTRSPPSAAAIEAALELSDNSHSKPERALSYLNYLSREQAQALIPYREKVLATVQSTLMENSEGSPALKAASILENAPNWGADQSMLQPLIATLLDPTSPHGAQRAASGALLRWKSVNSEYFKEVFNDPIRAQVEGHSSKAGDSKTIRTCRQILK